MNSSVFDLKTINNIEIKPYEKDDVSKTIAEDILGNYLTHRIAIAGPSECGKTILVTRILEKIINPEYTKIYWFSPTAKKDIEVQKFIRNTYFQMDDKGNLEQIHPLLMEIYENVIYKDEKTGNNINLIDIIKQLFDESPLIIDDVAIPKSVIIFDDQPALLKHASYLDSLCKTVRHLKSILIFSFHDLFDIQKCIRQEITISCIFAGASKERFIDYLKHNGFESDKITHQQLYSFYETYTSTEKHNFLYLNKRTKEIRLNLNKILC